MALKCNLDSWFSHQPCCVQRRGQIIWGGTLTRFRYSLWKRCCSATWTDIPPVTTDESPYKTLQTQTVSIITLNTQVYSTIALPTHFRNVFSLIRLKYNSHWGGKLHQNHDFCDRFGRPLPPCPLRSDGKMVTSTAGELAQKGICSYFTAIC